MAAGEVVKPKERTCRIPNIPAFRVGWWNGLYHSPAMLKELAENYQRFSDRYIPFGSVNHDDMLASGRISGARFDGTWLFLDLANVPAKVGEWWNAGRLQAPSIEYWDTRNDERARLMSGFRLPSGDPPGLVLRSLTLCGNQAPAVKAGANMPQAVYEFQDRAWSRDPRFEAIPATMRFNSEDFMDKAAMIASLKAADPSLTDRFLNMLSDDQLAALVDAKQAATASAAVDTATPAAPAMPGPGAPGGDSTAGSQAPPATEEMGGMDPTAMAGMPPAAQKMMRDAAADVAEIRRTKAQLADILKTTQAEHGKITNDRIRQFMDECSNRIPPAQRQFIEKSLRKCDGAVVRKFADGSKTGTELEEAMDDIRRTFPIDPRFVRKFSDGTVGDGGTVGSGGQSGRDRIEIAQRVLRAMPESAHLADSLGKRLST